jgi:hypothetical protein
MLAAMCNLLSDCDLFRHGPAPSGALLLGAGASPDELRHCQAYDSDECAGRHSDRAISRLGPLAAPQDGSSLGVAILFARKLPMISDEVQELAGRIDVLCHLVLEGPADTAVREQLFGALIAASDLFERLG